MLTVMDNRHGCGCNAGWNSSSSWSFSQTKLTTCFEHLYQFTRQFFDQMFLRPNLCLWVPLTGCVLTADCLKLDMTGLPALHCLATHNYDVLSQTQRPFFEIITPLYCTLQLYCNNFKVSHFEVEKLSVLSADGALCYKTPDTRNTGAE